MWGTDKINTLNIGKQILESDICHVEKQSRLGGVTQMQREYVTNFQWGSHDSLIEKVILE